MTCRSPARALNDVPLQELKHLLVLEGVNNPDNVGAIFRSAAAFGVDLVVLGPACGDPLYHKAIARFHAFCAPAGFIIGQAL